jgi:hypothetical protein
MINDLDETIRELILTGGRFEPDSVEVSFDQPTGDWAAGLTRPTINCYLYDIRENLELRSAEWRVERNSEGLASKRLAPRRFDLSYLITVWTQNQVDDEHAILWRVLGALARHAPLPAERLRGQLQNQPFPVPTQTAQPSMAVQNMPDLWGVMENQLRPSIDYVVTLAMEREIAFSGPLVLSRRLDLARREDGDALRESIFQVAGIVQRRSDGQALAEASVTLLERGETTLTDRYGRFGFARLEAGTYRIRVSSGGESAEHTVVVPAQGHDAAHYDLGL